MNTGRLALLDTVTAIGPADLHRGRCPQPVDAHPRGSRTGALGTVVRRTRRRQFHGGLPVTLQLEAADLTGLISRTELIEAVRAVLIDLATGRAEQPAPVTLAGTGSTRILLMAATSALATDVLARPDARGLVRRLPERRLGPRPPPALGPAPGRRRHGRIRRTRPGRSTRATRRARPRHHRGRGTVRPGLGPPPNRPSSTPHAKRAPREPR